MSIELLYLIRCDHEGCRNWNGAVRLYPERDQDQEDETMRRMNWSVRPDLCPEHRDRERGVTGG